MPPLLPDVANRQLAANIAPMTFDDGTYTYWVNLLPEQNAVQVAVTLDADDSNQGFVTVSNTGVSVATTFGDIDITADPGNVNIYGSQVGFFGHDPGVPATLTDPSGGGTVDTQSRTAIVAIIDLLQQYGLAT